MQLQGHVRLVAACRLQPRQMVLLYGCPGTGKTLLSQAIAHHAGAMWFDLSPRNLDGKYTGKAIVNMLHNVSFPLHSCLACKWNSGKACDIWLLTLACGMRLVGIVQQYVSKVCSRCERWRMTDRSVCLQVVKMAKALAPSVIYIDEVEKVYPCLCAVQAALSCENLNGCWIVSPTACRHACIADRSCASHAGVHHGQKKAEVVRRQPALQSHKERLPEAGAALPLALPHMRCHAGCILQLVMHIELC